MQVLAPKGAINNQTMTDNQIKGWMQVFFISIVDSLLQPYCLNEKFCGWRGAQASSGGNDLTLPNYRLPISRKPSEDTLSKRCSKKDGTPGQSSTKDHKKYGLHFLYLGFIKLQESRKLKTPQENEHCFSFTLRKVPPCNHSYESESPLLVSGDTEEKANKVRQQREGETHNSHNALNCCLSMELILHSLEVY